MYYANLSRNGHVTREGLTYSHVYLEDGSTSFEQIQIPFVGFMNSDFVDLPSGNVIMLSPFDVVLADDKLVLIKGYESKDMLLVMYSIPWHDDGYLGEILGGRAPESVFKFKSGHISDCFYHEYLLFLKRDVDYRFGYHSESSLNAFIVSMQWVRGQDDLVVKYFDPTNYF